MRVTTGAARKHSERTKTRSTSSSGASGTAPQRKSSSERPASDEEPQSDAGRAFAFKESDDGACQTTSDNTLVRETTDLCSVPEDEKREVLESCFTSSSSSSPISAGGSDNGPAHNTASTNTPDYDVPRHSMGSRRGGEQLLRRPPRKSIVFDERRVLEDIESVREEEGVGVRALPQEPVPAAEAVKDDDCDGDGGEGGGEGGRRRASESSARSSSVQHEEEEEQQQKGDSQKARLLRMVSIAVLAYIALAIFCLLCAFVIMWIERPSEQEAKVARRADLAAFAAEYSHFCIRNASDLLQLTTRVLALKDIVEELQPGFTNDIWTFDRSLIFIFTVVSSIGMQMNRVACSRYVQP